MKKGRKAILCLLVAAVFVMPISAVKNEVKNVVFATEKTVDDDCGCGVYDMSNYRFPVMTETFRPLNPKKASPKPAIIDTPDYFSWMDYEGQDWTTPVKNQLNCGCCWDFAAIGALESIINIRENNSELDMDLSEQYVLSCLSGIGSCRGGWSYFAFNYMKEYLIDGNYYNGALPESCFPYVGVDSYGNTGDESGFEPVLCSEKCDNWDEQLVPIQDCGYWIPDGSIEDRDAIKSQIMQHGPVCSYHYVTDHLFRWGYENHNSTDYYPYRGADGINHVVVIVGWKDDPSIDKGGYWIIKNSWGEEWGYNGFFNLEYNSLNIDSFEIDWVEYDVNRGNWNPYKPIIDGPDEAEIEEECTFSTVTMDPINRQIDYMFDWGDGNYSDWLGPYDSGNIITSSHSWNEKGLYKVRVKAKNGDNVESPWSDFIIVHIPRKMDGTDQTQRIYGGGYRGWGGMTFAQSFIPFENTLTMVSLFMQKVGDPIKIRISIRDELDHMDLTFIEFDAESISDVIGWHEFDFPDINVIPGNTYYIVWYPTAFDMDNTFVWGFAKDNRYPDGCAWKGFGVDFEELVISDYPDPDFCFKTYHAKSKKSMINPFIFDFLEQHPYLFPILRFLLGK